MKSGLTDVLCTRCALCCDGSLFADVELVGRAEATGLEILALEIEDNEAKGGLLLLPCRALRGTRCGEARRRIGQVQELMAQLGQRDARLPLKERCAEALSRGVGLNPEANQKRVELETAMSAVERLIRKRFLGGERLEREPRAQREPEP